MKITPEQLDEFVNMITHIGDAKTLKDTLIAGLRVSTIVSGDVGHETAIVDANGAHPVERYPDLESALAGHDKWVEASPSLTTITEIAYGSLVEPRTIELKRRKRSTKWDN